MFSKNIEYISRLEKSVMAYKNAYIFHFRFDPLNVVGCNPYLVLRSRIENFKPEYLRELLYSDRKLLDGWDKNMAVYARP